MLASAYAKTRKVNKKLPQVVIKDQGEVEDTEHRGYDIVNVFLF